MSDCYYFNTSFFYHPFHVPFALSQHLGGRDSLPGGVTYTFFSEEAQPLVVQPLLDCSGLTLTFFILCESPKCPVNTLGPRHLHCKSNPTFPCQLESVFSARLVTSFSIYWFSDMKSPMWPSGNFNSNSTQENHLYATPPYPY